MVDFRKSVHPSSVPEIAPFPAGPNKPPNLGGLDGWGRLALGYARYAVPKTAGRISMEKVHLGWLGCQLTRYGRLWLY
jgi:hypothetical protein